VPLHYDIVAYLSSVTTHTQLMNTLVTVDSFNAALSVQHLLID